MKDTIKSNKANGFYLEFSNGNKISVIWGHGSYSDNHDWMPKSGDIVEAYEALIPTPTTTVETMVSCPDKLYRKLQRKFPESANGNIFSYLTVGQLLEMLAILNKPVTN